MPAKKREKTAQQNAAEKAMVYDALITRLKVPQHVNNDASDTMGAYAPERKQLKEAWDPHSKALRPDLFPWDLGLDWREEKSGAEEPMENADATLGERLGEQLVASRYVRLDLRYTATPTRREAFEIMELMGLDVIPWGRVSEVPEWDEVVVYTNEYGGHVGQDKLKMTLTQAREQYPNALCSRYLKPDLGSGASAEAISMNERELVTGDWISRMQIYGSLDWRSNVGNETGEIQIKASAPTPREECSVHGRFSVQQLTGPLYAIDFIWHQGVRYAIDFNISPGAPNEVIERLPGPSISAATQQWSNWTRIQEKTRSMLPRRFPELIEKHQSAMLERHQKDYFTALQAGLRKEGLSEAMLSRMITEYAGEHRREKRVWTDFLVRFKSKQGGLASIDHAMRVTLEDSPESNQEPRLSELMIWLNHPASDEALGFKLYERRRETPAKQANADAKHQFRVIQQSDLVFEALRTSPDDEAVAITLAPNTTWGHHYVVTDQESQRHELVNSGLAIEEGELISTRQFGKAILAGAIPEPAGA